MALLEVKTEWAVYKDCFLQVARYQADNSRAIEIWNNEEQHGFGQATGRMVKSGYCTYPVVKLDIEKIGEYLEVA